MYNLAYKQQKNPEINLSPFKAITPCLTTINIDSKVNKNLNNEFKLSSYLILQYPNTLANVCPIPLIYALYELNIQK